MAQGIKTAHGECLSDYMAMLKRNDPPVMVCKSCAERRLITQDDLIEGAAIAGMPTLAEKIASPEYKVLIF